MEFVYVLFAILTTSATLCFSVGFMIGYRTKGHDDGDAHER